MTSIGLVCTPWKSQWMPSLQLGALASWIRKHVPAVALDEYHSYLDIAKAIGCDRYDEFSGLGGSGDGTIALPEAFYAALLFPGERKRIASHIQSSHGGNAPFDIDKLLDVLAGTTEECVERVARKRHALVGLSVSFFQTFASVYFAERLRQHDPDVLIVLGGAEVPGRVGASVLECFPTIDAIVSGEGERPLQAMCEIVQAAPPSEWRAKLASIPGVRVRGASNTSAPAHGDELASLDELPLPDYGEYFSQRGPELDSRPFRIPVETSRGCWWDRSALDPRKSCSFCNLNATWSRYRQQGSVRAARAFKTLARAHRSTRFMMVDNILRQGSSLEPFLDELKAGAPDLQIILEARASLHPRHIARLRDCGVEEIQFGIDGMSNGILRRVIKKGTTVLHNIQAMRWMDSLGMRHTGNLILWYPSATADEVRETIRNLDYVAGYQPLIGGRFWLGYYAPIFRLADEYGLQNIRNAASLEACLPPEVRRRFYTLERSYDHDLPDDVAQLWADVELKLSLTAMHHRRVTQRHRLRSLLLYNDGNDFVELIDWRGLEPCRVVLEGPHRDTYLSATVANSLDNVARAGGLSESELMRFVGAMVEQKLMYREGNRVLALAVPQALADPPADLAEQVPTGQTPPMEQLAMRRTRAGG